MAVVYNSISDGQSVSVWAGNFNTFGNAVKANIDTIESDINLLDANVSALSDTGIIVTKDSGTITTQTIGLTYSKVTMFNAIDINTLGSQVSVASDGTITFNTSAIFKMIFSGSFAGDNTEVVSFNYNYNNTHLVANPPQFVGGGSAKPIALSHSVVLNITSGDTLYIEAKSDNASTDILPHGCSLSIEKTSY